MTDCWYKQTFPFSVGDIFVPSSDLRCQNERREGYCHWYPWIRSTTMHSSSEDLDPDSNVKSCSVISKGGFLGSGGQTFPFAVLIWEVESVKLLRLSKFFSFCRWLLQTRFPTKYRNSSALKSRLWISA